MIDKDWYTMDGDEINIKEEIVKTTKDPGKIILIGTDSQRYDKRTDFVTVIVVRTPMKGGRVFYTRERNPKFYNIRDKLIQEAWLTIQTAHALAPILPEHTPIAALHADVNSDPARGKSAQWESEICGMMYGSTGFPIITKPEAWVASCISEHIVKNRHERHLGWDNKKEVA